MIDILQSKVIGANKLTWYMLSADVDDTKPTGEFPAGTGHHIANGSRLFENSTEIRYEYSEGVWNMVGTGLPEVTTDDNGKVLTVVEGEWDKTFPEAGLPDVTADDNGDVLTVVDGEWTKSAPQSPFKVVKASKSGNTITFVNETQKSIYESVNNGQFVVIDVVTGRTFRCYVSAISSTDVTFINIWRHGDTSATTFYYEFTVSKSSDSDHTTVDYSHSDDYTSSEPT